MSEQRTQAQGQEQAQVSSLTSSLREELKAKAREWHADFSQKAAAIQHVTADDLRARAR